MQSGPGSNNPQEQAGRNGRAPVSVPASGSSGELTVLQRLESFRDLIRHGNSLLGEVVAYCREAESAVAQIAEDKKNLDQIRTDLEAARARADSEADAARAAMERVENQARELSEMRDELVKARTEMEQFQQAQANNAQSLEESLRESREQQSRLEEELKRVRAQAVPTHQMSSRLAELEEMQRKLQVTESALAQTRNDLEAERERRNRAMSLIKPKQVVESGASDQIETNSQRRALKP